jgi:Leucine-rich repeat (LRR) protein
MDRALFSVCRNSRTHFWWKFRIFIPKKNMKRTLLYTLFLGLFMAGCSSDSDSDEDGVDPVPERRTSIPDRAFEEALVARSLDDVVDGSVLTSRIENIARLDVSNEGISDLTGIGDFTELTDLNVRENALRTLNLTSNRNLLFVWAEDNALTSLQLGSNQNIEKVGASGNQLTGLAVTEYTTLQLLDLANNNLVSMDVSTLPLPTFNEFKIEGNPLVCILVSPEQLEDIPTSWSKDEEDTYALDCE